MRCILPIEPNQYVGLLTKNTYCSGGSRQNVDRVLSQKNLAKNEIFVHFHSNLEILTGFQKPCDLVWIRHCIGFQNSIVCNGLHAITSERDQFPPGFLEMSHLWFCSQFRDTSEAIKVYQSEKLQPGKSLIILPALCLEAYDYTYFQWTEDKQGF